jgi:hypothetical protein
MPQHPWPSVGEFTDPILAALVCRRLTVEGIPHRIAPPNPFLSAHSISIWVPPEWLERAKELLSTDAVPEEDLTKAALSYPPPDDADNLK